MILVTGGTGFLGAHLLRQLCMMHEKVRAIHRPGSDMSFIRRVFENYSNDPEAAVARIEWVEADLLDSYAMEKALEGIQHLYHCAGEVSFVRSRRSEIFAANATATGRLANLCLEHPGIRFLHVSSIAALGRSRLDETIAEDRFWKNDPNNSWYAISKYNAEREIWRAIEEGLNAVIVNPGVILGYSPWEEGTGKMFRNVDRGMKYFTDGITGWVDVQDVAAVMIRLMESDIVAERFIVTADNRPYREIFTLIAGALQRPAPRIKATPLLRSLAWRLEALRCLLTGKEPLITRETALTAQLKCYYSNDKVKAALHYEFQPVEKTIAATAALYIRENR